MTRGRIAVLGAGKMGGALIAGLLRSGHTADDLLATTQEPERAEELRSRHGVEVVSNLEAARAAATVVLAVKPQDMGTLLEEVGTALAPGALVVSVAAGLPTSWLEGRLPAGTPVVRVMPNTPVLVDEGMSAVSAGSHATSEHLAYVEELLAPVGRVLRVPEYQLDAVTALSGSGPAYFFYMCEAMIEAGLLLGLPRSVAHELVVQTAVGSARMLREAGESPVALREAVTSPAGTTIAAIRELENHRVRAALLSALEAARDRSKELAAGTA
ncbi:pyrroline-5-carboxylate reductase [Motilibacter deserti]|uniref:Pyrroline-5-carboxylate reductase n=1 Tax=Motilibacter deserti TaxID=2714956 RepID=A0ABX0GYV3_9ACTN|nr:pyrroline-5-carboxylate reductase [Motilibacter deserti]NHC14866.1 pyrroline-5-carboxylate reductase [Motilibacter deserti]